MSKIDTHCIWCGDTGLCEYDVGGGEVGIRYCDCSKGHDLERAHEAAKERKFYDKAEDEK